MALPRPRPRPRSQHQPQPQPQQQPQPQPQQQHLKSNIFLAVACLWPLLLWVCFVFLFSDDSSPTASKVKAILSRVGTGPGPSHPRVAAVVVGTSHAEVEKTVESIFRNTDRNKIFVIVAVMDGVKESNLEEEPLTLLQKLNEIDYRVGGSSLSSLSLLEDLDPRVHVIYSPEKQGVTACRSDAVDFIQILARKHEEAGIKSREEDLILLLMREGAQLVDEPLWLNHVTTALVVPPPLPGDATATTTATATAADRSSSSTTLKLANAISFIEDDEVLYNTKGTQSSPVGHYQTFGWDLSPLDGTATAEDMAQSNGESYPAPALWGSATAMRLDTFVNLPARNHELVTPWASDLELSLNLWLCGDGIDVLSEVRVFYDGYQHLGPHDPVQLGAKIAAAWMDSTEARQVYHAMANTDPNIPEKMWENYMDRAPNSHTFPSGLKNKCRPFEWYAKEINPMLTTSFLEDHPGAAAAAAVQQHQRPVAPLPGQKLPLVPLSQAKLAILSTAKPKDITYVDASGGHREHPHKGALDMNGQFGYVADETALRRNPPLFNLTNNKAKEMACRQKDGTYRMLNEKVFVDLAAHAAKDKSDENKRDKIFCIVYTLESAHWKLEAIRETWGPKCDGFIVASNKTDPSVNAVNIVHEGPEEYRNIWQKVRAIWSYVYDNYYDKYDWFHIGGDDLYLIVENLRLYLESDEIQTAQNGGIYLPAASSKDKEENQQLQQPRLQTPLFLGRRFKERGNWNRIFNSGGSGYTLNKASLKTLVVDAFPVTFPHLHTFAEDVLVAACLRKFGIYPYETKDEAGGERYMPFQPANHYAYRLPKNGPPYKDWYANYSIDIKFGPDHCAARSIAFHYIKPPTLMMRIHALLYHYC